MIEIVLVALILLFFIYPIALSGMTLGIVSTYWLYHKVELFRHQPAPGKKILALIFITQVIRGIISVLLGFAMAYFVYALIVKYVYLFAFNTLSCTAISLRWFDYTHRPFRRFILNALDPAARKPDTTWNAHFSLCFGMKSGIGWGLGQSPVFVDAGWILWKDDAFAFHGIFFKQDFQPEHIGSVQKKSYEKIVLTPKTAMDKRGAESYLFVLKEKFYPFKSLETRNRIFQHLQQYMAAKKETLTYPPTS